MSIPAGLMPGSGALRLMTPGGTPGGVPGGGMEGLLGLLGMQQTPPQSGEENLFREASSAVGMVYQRIAPRSATAAKLLAEALTKINAAREALAKEGSRPLAGPPDLGAGMVGAPSPTMPMPGMGL